MDRPRSLDRHLPWRQRRGADLRFGLRQLLQPARDELHARRSLLASGFKGKAGDIDQIVFHATSGTIASHEASIQAVIAKAAKLPDVATVVSPFVGGSLQISKDDTIAYAVVYFTKPAFKLKDSQIRAVETIGATARSGDARRAVRWQRLRPARRAARARKGEIFGLIATAIVLLFAFGSFFAMLLPLGVALFALGVASAATTLLSHGLDHRPVRTDPRLAHRAGCRHRLRAVHRDALASGLETRHDRRGRVVTAIDTSGRAVLFAGSTVCIALLGMLVLRLSFLNGVAISGHADGRDHDVRLADPAAGRCSAFQKHHVLSRRERRALADHGPEPAVVAGGWQRWAAVRVAPSARPLARRARGDRRASRSPSSRCTWAAPTRARTRRTTTTRQAYDLLAKGFGPGLQRTAPIVGAIRNAGDQQAMVNLGSTLAPGQERRGGGRSAVPMSNNGNGRRHLPWCRSPVPRTSATSDLIDTHSRQLHPGGDVGASHTAIYVGGITAIFDDFATILWPRSRSSSA